MAYCKCTYSNLTGFNMKQKWANRSIYYQHADIVSGEALSAEVLVVAKSGAVCVPDVVLWKASIKCHPQAFLLCYKWTLRNCSSHMNVDSSHLDHVTKLVHLVHALAAQEPEESFFFTSCWSAHGWFEVELDWQCQFDTLEDCHVNCVVART